MPRSVVSSRTMARTYKFKIGDRVDFKPENRALREFCRERSGLSPPFTVHALSRNGYVYIDPKKRSDIAWLPDVYQLAEGPW